MWRDPMDYNIGVMHNARRTHLLKLLVSPKREAREGRSKGSDLYPNGCWLIMNALLLLV